MQSKMNREFSETRFIGYTPTNWAPYRTDAELDITADLNVLRATWDGLIIYGCKGTLKKIPAIAKACGFKKIILGVYNITDLDDVSAALELVETFPDFVLAVCLGNEGLIFNHYSREQLLKTFEIFRNRFPQLWLTTSEPIFGWGDPALLNAVDFCFPIVHPWIHEIFKSSPTAAAMWTIQAAQRLQILSDKIILIKETGFPADGLNYPLDLQVQFWEVLLRESGAFTKNVHLAFFEAFDIPEKIHFSACTDWDCYWGFFDKERKPKPVLSVIQRHLSLPPREVIRVTPAQEVTVVITCKDRPEFLEQAIESVLNQGEALTQLLLVDDGSENTEIKRLSFSYPESRKIKYLRLEGAGSAGSARNSGLRQVETEYVCFLDDDDAFLSEKLERQLGVFAKSSNLTFVATAAKIIDQRGELCARSGSPDFFPGAPLASMLAFCRLIHSSVMMKTAAVRQSGGYLEHFKGEDWELWCRLLREGCDLGFLDFPLTLYRRHDSNSSTPAYLREAVRNLFSRYLELSSATLLRPLTYAPESGELLKATLWMLHGLYREALELLDSIALPTAKIARFIAFRELGNYESAFAEIGSWSRLLGLSDQLLQRLDVHASRFRLRRHGAVVGSPAMLFEQRLLAQDALGAATLGNGHFTDLTRYFQQSPKYINIECASGDLEEDLLFHRVSLTSC